MQKRDIGTEASESECSKLSCPAWCLGLAPSRPSGRWANSGGNPRALRQGEPGRRSRLPTATRRAGRDPEADGGSRPSCPGRLARNGPRSSHRPSLRRRHHAPVPGEWSCRGAGRGLGSGPPEAPDPAATPWAPTAPRACPGPCGAGCVRRSDPVPGVVCSHQAPSVGRLRA